MKLTDFGTASPRTGARTWLSKEDEHSVVLATRAQRGDYDEGMDWQKYDTTSETMTFIRTDGV